MLSIIHSATRCLPPALTIFKPARGAWYGGMLFLCSLLAVNVSAIAQSGYRAALQNNSSQQSWHELSVEKAQHALNTGQLTSQALTQYYLKRIKRLDGLGPRLQSVIETNPDALAIAMQLDEERAAGKLRSPLHGLPVLLKANIATADATATSAGSLALKGFKAHRDAALVSQLRAAGAVVLGKTNLSEWANFRGQNSSSGWSSLGGQTRNPYVLDRSPCGSSSGSGVAVSADLSLLAIGTETDGSITCPAAMNGISGIKPTHGSVSGDGIIPIAASQDTAGPMARSVPDAAALLQAIVQPQMRERIGTDLHQHAQTSTLGDARIGVVTAFNEDFPFFEPILNSAIENTATAGATAVRIDRWELPDPVYDDEFTVLVYEYARDLQAWLDDFKQPNGLRSIADIVQFNQRNAATVLPFYGQEYLIAARDVNLEKQREAWQQARENSQRNSAQLIDQVLQEHQLDAILMPAYDLPWPIDHVSGDRFGMSTSSAAAISGYPSVTFPGGFVRELPVGLSLVGSAWQDRKIIGLAAAIERALQARQTPRFIPSLEH